MISRAAACVQLARRGPLDTSHTLSIQYPYGSLCLSLKCLRGARAAHPARPASGALHGYAIAQRIHVLSAEVLRVEEGSLYPALQKILLKAGSPPNGAFPKPIARSASTASRPPAAGNSKPNSPNTTA